MDRSKVEDIFRLSEAQETLLLHSVHGRGEDTGLLQLRATIVGPLDLDRFRRAWHVTIARHPMLRASVHWEGLKHPVQVIARTATIGVEEQDVSGASEAERLLHAERLLVEDRQRGLDLGTGPVMRVTVVRHAAQSHELLWTCHHLLLDGWSGAIVLHEVLEQYRGLRGLEAQLSSPGSFREYVAWARAQDGAAAEHFWRARLVDDGQSHVAHGSLPALSREVTHRASEVVTMPIGPVETWARTHGLTVGSVVFGCWALLVHIRSGTRRPIFGATLSGRSADIERFGSVVGMFANTVPLQLAIDPALSPSAWLRLVFEHQQEAQQFEHVPLGRILTWAALSSRPLPFDSLVVHANYPHHDLGIDRDATAEADDIRLTDFRGAVTSAFPVTLVAKREREFVFELLFDPARLHAGEASRVLTRFSSLLSAVLSPSCATVGDVLNAAAADVNAPVQATAVESTNTPPPVAEERPYVPAANAIEAQLMRIFDDLIDVDQVSREDNFFELGGDSLLVPLLIDRIEADFGVALPLGVIFEAPTVRALAAAVTSRQAHPSWRSLVGIREHGGRTPLYLVHGLGGEIDHFYHVARYLHPEQPVYALQPPPAEHTALEHIAEHYVREIRRTHPAGPYLIGGYCLGGCIAFEMARQLLDGGERVPLLMIIDSASPGTQPREPSAPPLLSRVRRLASSPPAEVLGKVKQRIRHGFSQLRARFVERVDPDALPRASVPTAFYDLATRHVNALRAYRPRPVGADAWLLRSADDRFAPDMGWRPLIQGQLTIETIPGYHHEVLKYPHVPYVARTITAALDTVAHRP